MKKTISNLLSLLIFTIIIVTFYIYRNEIVKFILDLTYPKNIVLKETNEYKVDYDFILVKNTDNFIVKDRKEFIDAFYTILNNGWDSFTFYCDDSYKECQDDINEYIKSNSLISSINNFVSPFNEYDNVSVVVNSLGKIDIDFIKNYTLEDIKLINEKLDEILSKTINDDMSDYEKIKKLHDYIINNSKYDNNRFNHATDILLYGYGNCSAYTDSMALLLNRLNIPNYRIASEEHTWNLVYIDGAWKHIDLTWDDPVDVNYKKDILTYDYFLIDTKKLLELDNEKHNFDFDIYVEAKM